MKRIRKKVGIVRGFPRVTQAEYASQFTRLEPVFVSPSFNVDAPEQRQELDKFCKQKQLERRVLGIKNMYGVDLVKWVLGKRTHQGWIGMKELEKAVKDVQVLETHELYLFDSGQAAKAAKRLDIPLVTEVWTSLAEHLAYKLPPYSWVAREVIRQTDLFVARSKRAKKALLKLGVDEKKIKTIYYGVNLERFYPAKSLASKPRVLYVGWLNRLKGVDLLLNMWPEVLKIKPEAELWLVGEGELEERAKRVKGVKVWGRVGHEKLPEIYRQAQVFVSLTRDWYFGPFKMAEEYFSHTLMEAQACGLAVIGTKCGGIPEEIGDNNWLVEQGDRAGTLKALLEVFNDKKRREKTGRENRKRAERCYDLSKQVKKLEIEIERLC